MADPLKSRVGAADPQDPNHSKYIRNLRSTDALMKQFCKVESGINKPLYDRGYDFAFRFTDEQKQAVMRLMDAGAPFEEAFDAVRAA
jgi:hypothetical protein